MPTHEIVLSTTERLTSFYFELGKTEAGLEALAMGRITNLPDRVKEILLADAPPDTHVHSVRTIREANRLPDSDIIIYDDGAEQAIYWHGTCLRIG